MSCQKSNFSSCQVFRLEFHWGNGLGCPGVGVDAPVSIYCRLVDSCFQFELQGWISQRVRTSPILGLVLGDTNCMDSPKLGRVTGPNSR